MPAHSPSILSSPLLAALMVLPACAPTHFDDPVAAMIDPTLTVRERHAALTQAEVSHADDPRRIETLKEIMSRPGFTLEYRVEVFEQLLAHDEREARGTLRYRLATLPSWDFVEWAAGTIAQRGWTEMTPSLIRSLHRPAPFWETEHRPEYRALAALHPDRDVRETIFEFIITPPEGVVHDLWRRHAWSLLNRLGEPHRWVDRLATVSTDDPLLLDLRAGWVELGVLARTVEEVRWLQHLSRPEYAEWWSECRRLVESLAEHQRDRLRLRHLPVIVEVSRRHPEWLKRDGTDLLADLEARLADRREFHPDSAKPGPGRVPSPQTLAAWRDRLSWGDLLTIHLADWMTRHPAVRRALFEQAEADRADTTTEYGGLMLFTPAGSMGFQPVREDASNGNPDARNEPRAVLFDPADREHDMKFIVSPEMVERGYTAPFHYHFHVQKVRNHAWAGPGAGDLQYADATSINGLVFTSVGEGVLNVDYYTEDRIAVDLGVITAEGK